MSGAEQPRCSQWRSVVFVMPHLKSLELDGFPLRFDHAAQRDDYSVPAMDFHGAQLHVLCPRVPT